MLPFLFPFYGVGLHIRIVFLKLVFLHLSWQYIIRTQKYWMIK